MFTNILVGLNGTSASWSAVALAGHWLRGQSAQVHGLAIVNEVAIRRPEPTGAWGSAFQAQYQDRALAQAQREAADVVQMFALRCQLAEVRHRATIEMGLPFERLLHHADDCDALLIGPHSSFHLGAQCYPDRTFDKLLRGASRPLVVVPPTLPSARGVLVRYDASAAAVRALESFTRSGLARSRTVSVEGIGKGREAEAIKYLRHFDIDARPASMAEDVGLCVMGLADDRRSRSQVEQSGRVLYLHR